jgi:hypothetical protein
VVRPSGCGILGELETATRGQVSFAIETTGRPVLSTVFQEQGVYPVFEEIKRDAPNTRRIARINVGQASVYAYLSEARCKLRSLSPDGTVGPIERSTRSSGQPKLFRLPGSRDHRSPSRG